MMKLLYYFSLQLLQNEEVLKAVTIPNVAANAHRHATHWPPNCQFYSGDWSSLIQLLEPAT